MTKHTHDHEHHATATATATAPVMSHCGPPPGHGHDDHDQHAGHDPEQFRRKFWWTLLLAGPVVAFSEMFADLVGYTRPANTAWISPVLGTVIFFYGGWPFLKGAVDEIRYRAPGMMLLIGLAITVSFVAS